MTDAVQPIPCQSSGCLPGEPAVRARELADEFNRSCFCITLDRDAMANAMQAVAVVPIAATAITGDSSIKATPAKYQIAPEYMGCRTKR